MIKVLITPRKIITENDTYQSLSTDWFNFLTYSGISFDILTNIDDVDKFINYDGIILSGGGDLSTNPFISSSIDIDIEREKIEKKLIAESIKHDIPLIGICRGYQSLVNNINGNNKIKFEKSNISILEKYETYFENEKKLKITCYNKYEFSNVDLENTWNVFSRSKNGFYSSMVHKQFRIIGCIWHPEREKLKNDLVWEKFLKWIKEPR